MGLVHTEVSLGPRGRVPAPSLSGKCSMTSGCADFASCRSARSSPPNISDIRLNHAAFGLNGAAQESNLPSRGLHDRTGFEDERRESQKEAIVQGGSRRPDPQRDCGRDCGRVLRVLGCPYARKGRRLANATKSAAIAGCDRRKVPRGVFSWPAALLPQQATPPSVSMPQLYEAPAPMLPATAPAGGKPERASPDRFTGGQQPPEGTLKPKVFRSPMNVYRPTWATAFGWVPRWCSALAA